MQTKKTKKDESIKMIPETKAIRFWNRYSMLILIGLGMMAAFIGIVITRLAKKAHQNNDLVTEEIILSKELQPVQDIETEEATLDESISYKVIGENQNGDKRVQFYENHLEKEEDFEKMQIVTEELSNKSDLKKVSQLVTSLVEEILSTPTPQSDTSNDSE